MVKPKKSGAIWPPVRAVLFDKDGTLVDFDQTWGPAVRIVLQRFARGDDALYRKLAAASGLIDGSHFGFDSPLINEPTNVFAARWAMLLGRPADTEFTAEINRLLRDATTAHLAPIGNPRAVLGELARQGYRLGLTTNDAEATARAHVQKLGIDHMLTFVAGYDSGFGVKPAPGPVLAFAAAVGKPAREIVMVGDTALDVAMARAAGTRAVVVLTGPESRGHSQEVQADAVIASIEQLSAWLKYQ
jgi:phosphoglycolate phosphatase